MATLALHCFEGLRITHCMPCSRRPPKDDAEARTQQGGSKSKSSKKRKIGSYSSSNSSRSKSWSSDAERKMARLDAAAARGFNSVSPLYNRQWRRQHLQAVEDRHRQHLQQHQQQHMALTGREEEEENESGYYYYGRQATVAMISTKHNWIARQARGNVDFAISSAAACATCLVSTQRTVASMNYNHNNNGNNHGNNNNSMPPFNMPRQAGGRRSSGMSNINNNSGGFADFLIVPNPVGQSIACAFEAQFAALMCSVVENCFQFNVATAICVVCNRQPYNVIGYPLLVRGTAEGVLLVWRDESVSPAEFNSLIVTA